jgi:hypothetical protein
LSELRVLLCWGCGGLPWARLQPGEQQRHQVGSLGSWIGLSASGTRYGLDISRMVTGESAICLSSLLHAEQQWLPAPGWLGRVEVELVAEGSRGAPPAPPLPSLTALSAGLADHCIQQLGEPGTLAVPWAWRELLLAQRLLAPWAERGWRFAALESLVQQAAGGGHRVITSDGPFLRLHGPVAQVVMPNSLEAAAALAVASEVLPRMLQSAGPTVASHWRQHEQERQLPLLHAMLARKVLQSLRMGAHAISLGGAEAPIFFAPGPGAPDALAALHDHRFRVFLPRLPDLAWWSKVAEPGFMRSPTGRVMIFGLDWKAVPTVEIEGPSSPWDLPAHLEAAGTQRSAMRAHALHDHAGPGEPMQAWFPTWVPEPAPEHEHGLGADRGAHEHDLGAHDLDLPEPEPEPNPEPAPPTSPLAPPPIPAPEAPSPPPPKPAPELDPVAPPPEGDDFSAAWESQRAPTLPPPPSLAPPPIPEPEAPASVPDQEPPTEGGAADVRPPSWAPTAPTPEPPAPANIGLPAFDPQQLTVRPPHRPDTLRLVVDGEPAPGAGLVPVGHGPDGRALYLVEDLPLRHGALVRVDFEPSWEGS